MKIQIFEKLNNEDLWDFEHRVNLFTADPDIVVKDIKPITDIGGSSDDFSSSITVMVIYSDKER